MSTPITVTGKFDAALNHIRTVVPHMCDRQWSLLHCVVECGEYAWERYAATWTMEETTEAFALLAGFTFILALTE
jgi:hypothetical protein